MWGTIAGFWNGYGDVLGAVAAIVACFRHAAAPQRSKLELSIAWALIAMALLVFVGYILIPDMPMSARNAATTLAFYVAGLYAVVCDALRFGLAAYLTRKRGEKWVKELDYVYLGLGAVGLFGSITRLNLGGDHYTRADILGPIVVATALVVRLVKTRAELGGWNRP